ncbi:MAG: hypothetical protein IT371_19220 [Deltaproteobacteria bacterium]|nr:hypothetical protein [Deltaproteobacteria bacterium]
MHPSIRQTVRAVQRRLRVQRSLEAAITATLASLLGAAVLLFLLKAGLLGPRHLLPALGVLAALPLLAALGAALRRIPPLHAAQLVDRTHALHDRLSTAFEFSSAAERTDFMRAQVEEAVTHLAHVRVARAAPWRWPRDARACGLLVLLVVAVGLVRFPTGQPPIIEGKVLPRLSVDPQELDPHRALVRQLQQEALKARQPELERLTADLNKIFDQLEKKELTRKELFAKLAELERKVMEGLDGDFDEVLKKLRKMAGELEKDKLTKDLSEALKQADLQRAKEELEKLAKDLEKLRSEEQKRLSKTLSRSAQQKLDQQDLQKKAEQLQNDIRRLQRQLEQKGKNPGQAKRRLERNRRELERLNRQRERMASQQRELERLNRQLQQAAAALQNRLSPEAMKALQKAAQQMSRFAEQLSRMQLMGKAQGQIMDLKEFLRRLGQSGGKISKAQLKDFLARAGGKDGQGKDGKDGQGKDGKGQKGVLLDPNGKDGTMVMPGGAMGQRPGQGPDSPNGQPGDGIGSGTDPNTRGDPTHLKSRRKDVFVKGMESKGPTRSEVILGAAEKGFSTQNYRRVYRDYTHIIEDVMKREEVPLGYRYYVKRYFELIKPR